MASSEHMDAGSGLRNMPNLYELQLADDEETEYDYCDDDSKLQSRNGSDSRTVRSLSMENMYSDDDLEKGDAGSPPCFGQSCVVRHDVTGRTGREIYKPSGDSPVHHHHHQQFTTSPSSSSSSSSKTPTLSPRRPVTIATSTLHVTPAPPTTLGQFRNWSVEAFEFAKQFVFEKIGRTQRTNDVELEKKVTLVRETQSQFRILFELAKSLAHQYRQVVQTQKILSEVFVDLSHGNPEEGLCEQFNCNALTQRLLAKNGDALLGSLDVFLRSISTLCNTTIEDTLATVKSLEKNRLKYDAYRSYVEKVRAAPRDHQYTMRLQEAERNFSKYQAKYGRLHHDLNIKLKFLEENKVKVCQKHLFLFHRGFLNYIAGNRQGIEDILRQFDGFSSPPSANPTTFLEVPLDLSSAPGSAVDRSQAEKSAPAQAPPETTPGSSSNGRPAESSELENHSKVCAGVGSTGFGENFKTQNSVGSR